MFELAAREAPLAEILLAGGWGLILGGVNHWLLLGPLRRAAQSRHTQMPGQPGDLVKMVYGRFLLRMVISLAGLAVAFWLWRDSAPVAATLIGLLLVNTLGLWQNHRRRRSDP